MTVWRCAITLVLLATVAVPLALPFREVCLHPAAGRALLETDRLVALVRNTGLLLAGTLALTLPLGVTGAILLYRTNLPFRKPLRYLIVLTLFVPLPLFASGWQAALGSGGWLPIASWSTLSPDDPDVAPTGIAWKPWAQGLGTAVWVHAVAGLPWVILLVGQGLRWVEPELEEDALLAAGPWHTLWQVTLRRSLPSIAAAGLWVALQTATEITVTDMMQVRTFAEEVYTQFVRPEPGLAGETVNDMLARALVVSVPAVLLTCILILWAARQWDRNLPARETLAAPPREYRLSWTRWPGLVLVLFVAGLLLGVPLASLVYKAGQIGGRPAGWSAQTAWHHLMIVGRGRGSMVGASLLVAVLAGAITACLALVTSWLAVGSRWFRVGAFSLLAGTWAMPGPVIGIGLKDTIALLIDTTHSPVLADALYFGPSPLPVIWACLVRFLPCAVAVLWPVVRLLPRELDDAAQVDGAGVGRRFCSIVLPLAAGTGVMAGLAVAVLSLGELSAGKLVSTPGWPTFAHEIFTEMHYGVTNNLAALCLILLALVAVATVLVAVFGRMKNEE